MKDNPIYSIPMRFRRIENLHILLWLIKDACWALDWRLPGLIMILPTITVAAIITVQTRKVLSELLHNLAVLFWISANCTWMIGEFFGWDEGPYGLRKLSIIPFSIGLLILVWYYLILMPNQRFRERMQQKTDEINHEEIVEEQLLHKDSVAQQ